MQQIMRVWVAVLVVAVILFFVGCGSTAPVFHPRDNSTIKLMTSGGAVAVRVEVADNEAEWQRGLMGRASLADDAGMLFVFPSEKIHDFWMKDTPIALDLLFFDEDLNLVYIKHNAPPCVKDPCPTFGAEKSSQYVLEVNGGWAQEHDVKLGDRLQR